MNLFTGTQNAFVVVMLPFCDQVLLCYKDDEREATQKKNNTEIYIPVKHFSLFSFCSFYLVVTCVRV